MSIIEKLEDYLPHRHPIILTIGNFDGMHRGHCHVLKQARALAGQEGELIALTFRNHPSEILRPEHPIPLLCSLPHKLRLLEQFPVDTLLLLPFTRYLAQHSAESFIEQIRQFIPFSHLVLGHDATLGRDRQGDSATMQKLGMEWGFQVHYLKEYRYEGKVVSSTRIREALQQGDFIQVEELLNRPYSIYGTVSTGQGKGKQLGFPTANLEVSRLCLPPFGVYAVEVICNGEHLAGIANLGIAPTLRESSQPILEVHVFENDCTWLHSNLEVFFKRFIRPEQKFNDIDALRQQIHKDIALAKSVYFPYNSLLKNFILQ